MTRHSFTFDFIPMATEPTKTMFSVKHIPLNDGVWGDVTRLMEMEVPIILSDLRPEDLLWVARSLAETAVSKMSDKLLERPASERK